jgi:hypothetical protein
MAFVLESRVKKAAAKPFGGKQAALFTAKTGTIGNVLNTAKEPAKAKRTERKPAAKAGQDKMRKLSELA